MDIIVDGNRNFHLEGEPADVLAAVVAVSDFLHDQGRAIMAVKADGKDVSSDALVESFQDVPLKELNCVEVTSEELSGLIESCLTEIQSVIPDLPEACRGLAAVFQGEEPEQGYEPFEQLAGIWGTLKAREMQIANALELPLHTVEIDGISLENHHNELNGYLNEAIEAIKTGDCVLLGDLLEYELAPRAETELKIVAMLAGESQKNPS